MVCLDTWSYRILGSDDGVDLYYDIVDFIVSRVPEAEVGRYEIPEDAYMETLKLYYEDLKAFIISKKTRLGYMILGIYLMSKGFPIDKEFKAKILHYSEWNFEKDQFTKEKYKKERKKYLDEFRKKLEGYDGSKKVFIPFDTYTSVINRKLDGAEGLGLNLPNIDYSIKENQEIQ